MNAPMLRRICAHSGSSLGSNTTHCVPRIEAFFDEERERGGPGCISIRRRRASCAPQRARAPAPRAVDREVTEAIDA